MSIWINGIKIGGGGTRGPGWNFSVKDTTELADLPEPKNENVVYVADEDSWYEFDTSATSGIAPTDGTPGYWVRVTTFRASQLPYTPTTPGDWSPPPDDVGEALDQLAAGGGGGGKQSYNFTFGRDQLNVSGGTYLRSPDSVSSSAAQQIVPFAGLLTHLTVGTSTAENYSIELLVNGVLAATITSGGTKNTVLAISVAVAAGDEISARVAGATVSAPDRPVLNVFGEAA